MSKSMMNIGIVLSDRCAMVQAGLKLWNIHRYQMFFYGLYDNLIIGGVK